MIQFIPAAHIWTALRICKMIERQKRESIFKNLGFEWLNNVSVVCDICQAMGK